MSPECGVEGGRGTQTCTPAPLPDTVGAKKKSSTHNTPWTPVRSVDNGVADKTKKTTNTNLTKGNILWHDHLSGYGHEMWTERTLMWLGCGDSSMVPCIIWRRDRVRLYFRWKTGWWSQEKYYGQETGKHIEVRNQYQIADLWWQWSLHRWWWRIQETHVSCMHPVFVIIIGEDSMGRRLVEKKGVKEVVVIWTESVSLVTESGLFDSWEYVLQTFVIVFT